MKELENIHTDKLEVSTEIPAKSELKYLGTSKLNKGHKCFEINLRLKHISEAEFESEDVKFEDIANKSKTKKASVRHKIIMKPDCVYVTALNKQNAIKKFFKNL